MKKYIRQHQKRTKISAKLEPFWYSFHLRAETVNNIAITKLKKDIQLGGVNN